MTWLGEVVHVVSSVQVAEPTIPEMLEHIHHALTANELAEILGVSPKTLFKRAKAHTVPCFRVGTCVRFDPVHVARWLRTQ